MRACALPLLFSACAACSSPAATSYSGTLAVDIRDQVAVTVTPRGEGGADVALAFQGSGLGVFDAAAPLAAAGRVEPFPEAGLVLYTGRFRAPPAPGGPCGAQPVSLALSLARRGDSDRVGGSLTAYCGADRYAGVPARVLRLSGDLPRTP